MKTDFSKVNETVLYQKDSKGRVKVWSIYVDGTQSNLVRIVSHSGLEGGKMTPDVTLIDKGKNEGRANATTPYSQAIAETQSKVDAKIREGYVADRAKVKESSVLGSGCPQPMLAQKYDPKGKQNSSKTLEKMGIKGKKISCQPKFDGHRRLIHLTFDKATQYTRKGDVAIPMEHWNDQLLEFAEHIMTKLGLTEIWIDGEAFTDEVSFNELSSLLRKESGVTKEEAVMRKKINLRLYDVILPVGYEERYKVIQEFASENIIVVENHVIEATDENLQKLLEKFLEEGHEGAMIRVHGIGYENKRTWQLCKFKIFEDEEFEITGGEESVKKGMLGAFIVMDKQGNEFRTALKYSHPERKEMWENLQNYIGQMATVEFFGKSEYGIPRFPKTKAIRKD